ncbi:hypothetical protein CL622_05500 [archaeon]|nr:hypothetical protein [archaeon]|tara:strand:- start:2099 stop:2755 length:657 start_codon:yes stop_codon:yes gene_type:complete
MDAIILAGGRGTRMNKDMPKILVSARNKTILSHQLNYLLPKVDNTVLALGHRAEEVTNYIKENYPSASILSSIEKEPLGTGGAIKLALNHVKSDKVLILNGDDLTDIDLNSVSQIGEDTICVARPRLPFGLVREKDGYATFDEKPVLENEWVSCGWYVLDCATLRQHLPDKGSIEYEVFPKLKLRVHKHSGFWQTLNSEKDIQQFEERTQVPSHIDEK